MLEIEQSRYQVRFDWSLEGANVIGSDADVIVWADAIAPGGSIAVLETLPAQAAVIEANFATAGAVAQWILDLQKSLARRIVIAIVAAGETRASGTSRFAVEDFLAAGAVIDRLAAGGLDATSPEAASAEGSYRHLARAVGHLMTASVTAATIDEKLTSADFKVNDALGVDDVVVLRTHPEL